MKFTDKTEGHSAYRRSKFQGQMYKLAKAGGKNIFFNFFKRCNGETIAVSSSLNCRDEY